MSNNTRRPDVFERDIDALIEKKFNTDPNFAKNFIEIISKQSKIQIAYDGLGVDRQAPHEGSRGTIDLLVRLFERNQKRYAEF